MMATIVPGIDWAWIVSGILFFLVALAILLAISAINELFGYIKRRWL